ncbi:MAG: hypothetical protein ACRD4T_14525, partial [Candidatus Acidiferrales bacterium]
MNSEMEEYPGASLFRWLAYTVLVALALFSLVGLVFFILNFGNLRAPLLAKFVLGLMFPVGLFFLFATWMWTIKWRKLGWSNSWELLTAPRPTAEDELAAWVWG